MTLHFSNLNLWAILVCIVSNMVIGGLWYSPILFGNIWLKSINKKASDISREDANKTMMISLIPAILTVFFLAVTISFVNAVTVVDALVIGTLVSLGFIGMNLINLVLFENRSMKLTLISIGYSFVSLNIAAVILTLWK
ncbi:MAG: DUF1761 domain-containing protein [Candidatus Zhuqueibacterota bacterium]